MPELPSGLARFYPPAVPLIDIGAATLWNLEMKARAGKLLCLAGINKRAANPLAATRGRARS
jgi:hypothetical protein